MSEIKRRHPRRSDQEWVDLISECRTSGMTDKAWCEAHHISTSKFYYHIRRLRKKAYILPDNPLVTTFTEKQEVIKLEFDTCSVKTDTICESDSIGILHSNEPAIRLNFYGCQVEISNSAAAETIQNTLTALHSLC